MLAYHCTCAADYAQRPGSKPSTCPSRAIKKENDEGRRGQNSLLHVSCSILAAP